MIVGESQELPNSSTSKHYDRFSKTKARMGLDSFRYEEIYILAPCQPFPHFACCVISVFSEHLLEKEHENTAIAGTIEQTRDPR